MTFQHASWRPLLQGLAEFLALSSSAHLILLPGWPDLNGRLQRDEYCLRPGDAMLVGQAQAVAIVPGTWRSGITMTVALALGLTRPAAARFSLLLSIPVIATAAVDWLHLAIGIAVSGVSAWACIHFSYG